MDLLYGNWFTIAEKLSQSQSIIKGQILLWIYIIADELL